MRERYEALREDYETVKARLDAQDELISNLERRFVASLHILEALGKRKTDTEAVHVNERLVILTDRFNNLEDRIIKALEGFK